MEKLQAIGERHDGFREGYDLRDASIRLGNTLRQLRESVGLTQKQLENRAGLPHAAVSRIESGLDPHGQQLDAVLSFVNGCDASLSLAIYLRSAGHLGRPCDALQVCLFER